MWVYPLFYQAARVGYYDRLLSILLGYPIPKPSVDEKMAKIIKSHLEHLSFTTDAEALYAFIEEYAIYLLGNHAHELPSLHPARPPLYLHEHLLTVVLIHTRTLFPESGKDEAIRSFVTKRAEKSLRVRFYASAIRTYLRDLEPERLLEACSGEAERRFVQVIFGTEALYVPEHEEDLEETRRKEAESAKAISDAFFESSNILDASKRAFIAAFTEYVKATSQLKYVLLRYTPDRGMRCITLKRKKGDDGKSVHKPVFEPLKSGQIVPRGALCFDSYDEIEVLIRNYLREVDREEMIVSRVSTKPENIRWTKLKERPQAYLLREAFLLHEEPVRLGQETKGGYMFL